VKLVRVARAQDRRRRERGMRRNQLQLKRRTVERAAAGIQLGGAQTRRKRPPFRATSRSVSKNGRRRASCVVACPAVGGNVGGSVLRR